MHAIFEILSIAAQFKRNRKIKQKNDENKRKQKQAVNITNFINSFFFIYLSHFSFMVYKTILFCGNKELTNSILAPLKN